MPISTKNNYYKFMRAKKYSFKSYTTFLVFLTLSINGILTPAYAQCPTVTEPIQSLCNVQSVLVSDLQATDTGGGIVWYDSATSTTPLSNSQGLISGEDYYADNNAGTCTTRARVDVIIYSAPVGDNYQGICIDDPSLATVSSLNAVGNDVQWYLTSSGGLPLNETDVLIDDTLYYADQASPDGNCRTSRLSVLVNVGSTLLPEGDPIQQFCISSSFQPTLNDLVATGNNNWYNSLFSAVTLPLSTPLVNGQTYYATAVDPPCESTARLAITVILNNFPDAGENATVDICENNNSTINLFTALEGTPNTGGFWSPSLNSGTNIFDPAIDPSGIYTYTVGAPATCGYATATVNVSFSDNEDAGEDGAIEVCENNGTFNLFNSLNGTPNTGGTWSPALNSGTGLFDPNFDTAGTYTYTILSTTSCPDSSANVEVSILQEPDAGSNAILDICSNNENTINLFETLNGTPENGGFWSPSLNSGTNIFDPAIDPSGIYTYTVGSPSSCGYATATVDISISVYENAGENGVIEVCENDSPFDLFNSLNGTPSTGGTWSPTLNSGTGLFDPSFDTAGTYTYTILSTTSCPDSSANVEVSILQVPDAGSNAVLDICSNNENTINLFETLNGTPENGGFWSPSLNSGTNIFDPTIDPSGIYTYTIGDPSSCGYATATVDISISVYENAGENGTVEVCENDSPFNLFNNLNGTPSTGGNWSPALNSGTGLFDPSFDTAGTYTYTILGTASCPDSSANVEVSILQVPDAGSNAVLDICSNNENTINLFETLNGTPETGGFWSPSLNSGTNIFDPTIDPSGIYTYTIGDPSSSCGYATATVDISISVYENAGENGTVEVCENDSPFNLFNNLNGTPSTGGTWSPTLNSGTGLFDPSFDTAGTYTYTILGTASCPDSSANVEVSILQEPNSGTNTTIDICSNDIVNLYESLNGTPDIGGTWTPLLNSGTDIFDPSIDVAGTYTYEVTNSCSTSSSSMIITISNPNDAGANGSVEFCSDELNTIDLYDVLEGTPQLGGEWSPALTSGSSLFDPNVDAPGIYTYTVSNTSSTCPEATASVTVTLIAPPNAGNDNIINICSNDTITDLFDNLGGTPDAGGIWTPSLASGTGEFDPNIDQAGDYTYTLTSTECNITDTATVTVTILEIPNATGLTLQMDDNFVCQNNEDIVINITNATQLTDADYSIEYSITGSNNSINTTIITIIDGNAALVIPASLLSNPGNSIITIIHLFALNQNCSAITDTLEPFEIEIQESLIPEIINNDIEYCLGDILTVADLTNNIVSVEDNDIIWYDESTNGTPYDSTETLINGLTYYAAYQSEYGCQSNTRLEFTLNLVSCVEELLIPDGFSPNGDGINDVFDILYLNDLYPNFKLSIYNRYGNIFYEGNINSPKWNGTGKKDNSVLPSGVYFYILEFNDGEREPKQGRVYLNR
ncbi:gliding motility-associated C-terminal domain-containing protein [Winogradskyella sp. HaHa_3_26]|uniref:gliding motility-associated C-terminal domain-containing protein n=1 Tax=Winogradskyella sp. HaHa_3_26 TaxID=2749995 RepID=UPI001C4F52CF|nr:gliding motility-associated C-terminal domain-containing protein [Winogradskyella sp. HaHa_3_26]QXP77961.1 gliding motility-associated C-terminal domain-containing protein [Winogradskyella sp. HaHa_3_26]